MRSECPPLPNRKHVDVVVEKGRAKVVALDLCEVVGILVSDVFDHRRDRVVTV